MGLVNKTNIEINNDEQKAEGLMNYLRHVWYWILYTGFTLLVLLVFVSSGLFSDMNQAVNLYVIIAIYVYLYIQFVEPYFKKLVGLN